MEAQYEYKSVKKEKTNVTLLEAAEDGYKSLSLSTQAYKGCELKLGFITLSSPITILPFRVNNLHVSNVTSRFPANARIILSVIITSTLMQRGQIT